jgi:hypothetical protein
VGRTLGWISIGLGGAKIAGLDKDTPSFVTIGAWRQHLEDNQQLKLG